MKQIMPQRIVTGPRHIWIFLQIPCAIKKPGRGNQTHITMQSDAFYSEAGGPERIISKSVVPLQGPPSTRILNLVEKAFCLLSFCLFLFGLRNKPLVLCAFLGELGG